jgi:hypothetical protein
MDKREELDRMGSEIELDRIVIKNNEFSDPTGDATFITVGPNGRLVIEGCEIRGIIGIFTHDADPDAGVILADQINESQKVTSYKLIGGQTRMTEMAFGRARDYDRTAPQRERWARTGAITRNENPILVAGGVLYFVTDDPIEPRLFIDWHVDCSYYPTRITKQGWMRPYTWDREAVQAYLERWDAHYDQGAPAPEWPMVVPCSLEIAAADE